MGKMKAAIVQKLFDINGQFYQEFGHSFAETRKRIQPGIKRILSELIRDGNWLDLGCGSGALALAWAQMGIRGLYEGVDFSPVLIAEAMKVTHSLELKPDQRIQFHQANLANANWMAVCSQTSYDGVLMFAAFHHIPGSETRQWLLRQIAAMLEPGGYFIHSEWQFQNSAKLLARIQPWSLADLTEEDAEPGDTLLDWRHTLPTQNGRPGLRYVHLFSREELGRLAEGSGFKIVAEFESDGAAGNLGLYQIWQRV